jgi:thiol-disulfide isomerase/thioredoxin
MTRRSTAVSSLVLFAFWCVSGTWLAAADRSVVKAITKGQGDKPDKAVRGRGVAGKEAIPAEWLEGTPDKRRELDALQGKAPPALQTTGWINREPVTLEQLKGKVVLLDFWATWCGPCIAAIPPTNELQAKYGERGLVIIGVCHPQGVEKMEQMAREKGIKYAVTADKEGATIKAYKVNSYPDYYFIDRSGNLRIADCANGNVDQAIELLLAEKAKAER